MKRIFIIEPGGEKFLGTVEEFNRTFLFTEEFIRDWCKAKGYTFEARNMTDADLDQYKAEVKCLDKTRWPAKVQFDPPFNG